MTGNCDRASVRCYARFEIQCSICRHPYCEMRRFLNPGLLTFAGLYLASFAVLSKTPEFAPGDTLFELVLFGLIFPGLAWLTTLRSRKLEIRNSRTAVEFLLTLLLVVAIGIYLINGPQSIDALFPQAWIESARTHFFVSLARKLVVFVFLPFAALRLLFGYRWRDFGLQAAALRELGKSHFLVVLVLCGAVLLFQYFMGGAARPLREGKFSSAQLLAALPICFVWLAVEAGLVEEFFFRGLVQSRLSAWFRSETSGVALMAIIFGLAHAPGLILRGAGEVEGLGAHPNAMQAVAYTIVTMAPGALVFGVVWARTRNLFAVILIHAAVDLLPNVSAFIETWRIGR